jgi:FkbM family methyltransferase
MSGGIQQIPTRRLRKPPAVVTTGRAALRIRNWPAYVLRRWRQPGSSLYESRNGVKYQVPFAVANTFRHVVVDDSYRMAGLIPKLGPHPVIVDIGANAGFFSIQAAELIPGAEVYSYEPLPANYAALETNRALNPELAPRIHAYACAVTGKPVDTVTIYGQAGKNESGQASINAAWTAGDKFSTTVPAVTLEGIVETLAPRTINLLKIDCEGAEYEIFFEAPAAAYSKIGRIVMEVHNRPVLIHKHDDMVAFLRGHGYTVEMAVDRLDRNALLWAWRGADGF